MMRLSAYARELGADLASIERGRARLELPYKDAFVGDPDTGVIAGGIVTALLDTACGYAVWSALPEFQSIATLTCASTTCARPPARALQARPSATSSAARSPLCAALAFDGRADPGGRRPGRLLLNSDGGGAGPIWPGSGANEDPNARSAVLARIPYVAHLGAAPSCTATR
jgi:hypothetical protein